MAKLSYHDFYWNYLALKSFGIDLGCDDSSQGIPLLMDGYVHLAWKAIYSKLGLPEDIDYDIWSLRLIPGVYEFMSTTTCEEKYSVSLIFLNTAIREGITLDPSKWQLHLAASWQGTPTNRNIDFSVNLSLQILPGLTEYGKDVLDIPSTQEDVKVAVFPADSFSGAWSHIKKQGWTVVRKTENQGEPIFSGFVSYVFAYFKILAYERKKELGKLESGCHDKFEKFGGKIKITTGAFS